MASNDSESALCEVLEDWREAKTAEIYGMAHLRDHGPGSSMPLAVLDRIVDGAQHYSIRSVDELKKETGWSDADRFGTEIVTLIQQYVPWLDQPRPQPLASISPRSQSQPGSLLVLSSADVSAISSQLFPPDLDSLMTSVFARLSSRSSFQAPHRSALSLPNHTALFMPSTALGIGTAIKAVSVPSSPTDIRGLPASTLVIDDDTGAVKAIVNARSLTATRNAAGSVLASRLLLSKTPTTLVAFGAGKQIEAHVDLHLRAFPSLNTITLVNRSVNDRVLALLNILHARHPLITFNVLASTPTPADNPDSNVSTNSGDHLDLESLVRAAHIICTATPSTSPLFPSSWVSPGTHLNLVGSFKPTMREIDDALVKRAGVVVVDSREACLVEAGELIGAGLGEESMVEIGEIVAINVGDGEAEKLKKCVDVRSKGDVTIFKSVGVGLQDVAIACLVVKRAEEMGVGVHVEAYDA